MKIKDGYTLHTVCDELLLIPTDENIESDGISLDDVSADLWLAMKEKESFNVETLAETLMEIYDVDKETALEDCQEIAATWLEMGIAQE